MSAGGNGVARYRIVYHPGADADLAAILNRISATAKNPLPALRFLAAVERFVDKLAVLPGAYAPVDAGSPRPAYSRPFKKTYLIYHEVFEVEKIVRILYVWHGYRNDRPDLGRQDDPLLP